MTRVSLFNSPLMLGFDHFEQMLERVSRAGSDGYPPYNVEHAGPNRLRITLALAGFRAADLTIAVEDNQLIVRGKQEEESDRKYIYRGIAARQFQRSFLLAEGIEVTEAQLEDGLLHIDLVKPTPQSKRRTIEIQTKNAGGRAKEIAAKQKDG